MFLLDSSHQTEFLFQKYTTPVQIKKRKIVVPESGEC